MVSGRHGPHSSRLIRSRTDVTYQHCSSVVAHVVRVLVLVRHLALVADHVGALAEVDGLLPSTHPATEMGLLAAGSDSGSIDLLL